MSLPASGAPAPFTTASTQPIHSDVHIRAMSAQDLPWVEQQQARVFGPGRFARAAFRVREVLPPDLDLCAVAERGGAIIGSVVMTPISVGGVNGSLLGPLAVEESARNLGAGRLLVKHVTALSNVVEGNQFVLLVGDRAYYQPLGFLPTTIRAIKFPAPVDPERVLANCSDARLAEQLGGQILGPVSK